MITRESKCILQVFNKAGYHSQVFTTIELVAKTVFQGQNDIFDIKKYALFIGGRSVIIEITLEGLPKIIIALKDEETLIAVIISELSG